MSAIGRLYQTTAFKLSLIYLLVFAAFAGFMIYYFAHNTGEILARQHIRAMADETRALRSVYRRGGIRRLAAVIDRQSRRPGAGLYLMTDPAGNILAGNIAAMPGDVLDRPGVHPVPYRSFGDDDETRPALASATVLSNGFRLVVGRDIGEAERFRGVVRRATFWAVGLMLLLALASGFFISRRVLRRMEGVTEASEAIMAGDLSGRIPVTGSGDEFDRLAVGLNEMLGRIEALLGGMKDVSDNVAHDLKTPLTRLRGRLEALLRESGNGQTLDSDTWRVALEDSLAECDRLIETFNALLSIARAEAGETGGMEAFDAAEMVSDLGELYEPVAEDTGMAFSVEAPERLEVEGNRHLLGQAVSNLIDNALKYAGKAGSEIKLSLRGDAAGVYLTVMDSGPGIPAADRERVVERFVRLDESRSAPGSGLGLALARAAAQRHGGRLVLSDNAPGLKATIHLPSAEKGGVPQ